mmetsp:Transcript_40180/g.97711  ORF Transcript_40180/g.97711 Transcript_40180/m.97711 type:complete len:232 (+) Transcript_40180:369-1064(+)
MEGKHHAQGGGRARLDALRQALPHSLPREHRGLPPREGLLHPHRGRRRGGAAGGARRLLLPQDGQARLGRGQGGGGPPPPQDGPGGGRHVGDGAARGPGEADLVRVGLQRRHARPLPLRQRQAAPARRAHAHAQRPRHSADPRAPPGPPPVEEGQGGGGAGVQRREVGGPARGGGTEAYQDGCAGVARAQQPAACARVPGKVRVERAQEGGRDAAEQAFQRDPRGPAARAV